MRFLPTYPNGTPFLDILRKHRHTVALAGLLVTMQVVGHAEEHSPQVWTMQSVAQRFDYGLEAVLDAEQRYATDHGRVLRRNELSPQLVWHYSPRYDFGIGYERMDEWDMEGMHTSADEGFFWGSVLFSLRDWRFSSRQRFQFGVEEGESTGVFRHRVQVAYEGERLPFRLMPFLANEWYFDLLGGEFTENRLWGGLRYRINRTTEVEVFGMRVDDFTHPMSHVQPVAGVAINLKF